MSTKEKPKLKTVSVSQVAIDIVSLSLNISRWEAQKKLYEIAVDLWQACFLEDSDDICSKHIKIPGVKAPISFMAINYGRQVLVSAVDNARVDLKATETDAKIFEEDFMGISDSKKAKNQ